MDSSLKELLFHPIIGKKICKFLSFDDIVSIQLMVGREKLPCRIKIRDKHGHVCILKEINKETILTYRLISPPVDINNVFLQSVELGHLSQVKILLEGGADINSKEFWGRPALVLATNKDNYEMIKLLLAHKIDINATNQQGLTALMFACWRENFEIVRLLLENQAAVNISDNGNQTARTLASRKQNHEIIELLKSYGAS